VSSVCLAKDSPDKEHSRLSHFCNTVIQPRMSSLEKDTVEQKSLSSYDYAVRCSRCRGEAKERKERQNRIQAADKGSGCQLMHITSIEPK
jgi:hypothetical protein